MKFSLSKKNFNLVKIVILLFIVLFAPPIIPYININIPLSFISILIIYTKYKQTAKKLICNKYVNNFIKYYCIFVLFLIPYILFRELFNNIGLNPLLLTIYRFFLLCPVYLINLLLIFCIAKTNTISSKKLIQMALYAFVIQSILSIICLLIPDVRNYFVSLMIRNESNDILFTGWQLERRFYGFSNNLLDTFGLGVGIAATIPFYLEKKVTIGSAILSFTILISTILNSRTGILIYIIGLGFYILYNLLSSKNILRTIKKYLEIIILAFIIIFILRIVLLQISAKTLIWIEEGFSGLFSVFSGDSANAADSMGRLFDSESWILPNNIIDLLFGRGHVIYSGIGGIAKSDVGYVNDIWLVGILGLPFFYLPFFYLYKSLYKQNSLILKFLSIFFLTSFLVFNVKGMVIAYNTGIAIQLYIIFSILLFDFHEI